MSQLSTLGGFTAGALAACGAVTVTNPMEVVKTRLQLQGELASKGQVKKVYTGVFQALRKIAINEGIKGLFTFSRLANLIRNTAGFGSCGFAKVFMFTEFCSTVIKYVLMAVVWDSMNLYGPDWQSIHTDHQTNRTQLST